MITYDCIIVFFFFLCLISLIVVYIYNIYNVPIMIFGCLLYKKPRIFK